MTKSSRKQSIKCFFGLHSPEWVHDPELQKKYKIPDRQARFNPLGVVERRLEVKRCKHCGKTEEMCRIAVERVVDGRWISGGKTWTNREHAIMLLANKKMRERGFKATLARLQFKAAWRDCMWEAEYEIDTCLEENSWASEEAVYKQFISENEARE